MAEVKQQFTKAKPGQSIWVGIVKQTWLEHLEPFASMEADPKRNNKPVSLSRQEWLASSVKELHSSREGSTTTIGVDAHVLLTASSACCSKKFGSSIRSSVFSWTYGPSLDMQICIWKQALFPSNQTKMFQLAEVHWAIGWPHQYTSQSHPVVCPQMSEGGCNQKPGIKHCHLTYMCQRPFHNIGSRAYLKTKNQTTSERMFESITR